MVSMPKWSAAGYARRAARAGQSHAEFQSQVDEVSKRIDLTMRQRVSIAVDFLVDKIVKNINVPVTKAVIRGKTVVTQRSKPGEFPRADTEHLRNTTQNCHGVNDDGNGFIMGWVGTVLDYGLELETRMDRRFLTRTLDEERETITRILTGPIA